MEFDNATNLDRKSGVRGTKKTGRSPPPLLLLLRREVSAVTPFWESIGNQSLLSQVRWGEPGAPKSNESASGLEHGFKAAVHLFLLDKLTALGGR